MLLAGGHSEKEADWVVKQLPKDNSVSEGSQVAVQGINGAKSGNIASLNEETKMRLAEIVQEQIKALPEGQVKEVLDFIGYLKSRNDRSQWNDLMQAQEKSLAQVWDNPDDEVWNHV